MLKLYPIHSLVETGRSLYCVTLYYGEVVLQLTELVEPQRILVDSCTSTFIIVERLGASIWKVVIIIVLRRFRLGETSLAELLMHHNPNCLRALLSNEISILGRTERAINVLIVVVSRLLVNMALLEAIPNTLRSQPKALSAA